MIALLHFVRRTVSVFLFGLPLDTSRLAIFRDLSSTHISPESTEKQALTPIASMARELPFSFFDRSSLT